VNHVEGSGSRDTAAATTTPPALAIPRGSDQKSDVIVGSGDDDEFVDAPSEPEDDNEEDGDDAGKPSQTRRSSNKSNKSFVTASSVQLAVDDDDDDAADDAPPGPELGQAQGNGLHVPPGQDGMSQKSLGKRPLSTIDSHNASASPGGGASVDAGSTSSLLRKTDSSKAHASANLHSVPPKGIMARVKRRSDPALSRSDDLGGANSSSNGLAHKRSNLRSLVKFDLPEDSKRAKVQLKAKHAQMTIQRVPTKLRKQKLKDGLVVKMERMLVRVDATAGEVPDDFDENVNQKVTSRVKDKWREYMIVCRHSRMDKADFVLQLYKTRVCCTLRNYAKRY
jgi:hypothetical protein